MRGGEILPLSQLNCPDQIMLVTSKGQSIRVPVDGISFRSRLQAGCVYLTRERMKRSSLLLIADQGEEDGDVIDGDQTE